MTTETSDITLELVGPERVSAIASGSHTEGTGNAVELAERVRTVLPSGITPEPEQILSYSPDLVLMTGRHDGEEDAANLLEESGVPTLVFDSADFSTPQAVADSVRTLGQALGAEDEADTQALKIESQVKDVESAVGNTSEQPRVLTLMARGDSVMVTGEGGTLTSLAEMSGADPVALEQGWSGAIPADPELILLTEPDIILVEDFRSAGMEPFRELLEAPAIAGVPAIAKDEVHLIPSSIASGSAGLRIGDGLLEVASIIHPESF